MKVPKIYETKLEAIVGGGQALGLAPDGRKFFVWGGLPGETVEAQVTKKKSKLLQGVVTNVITPSPERVEPRDPGSYLSTSPWQIMNFNAEQHYKAALIVEAFDLHNVTLPGTIDIYSDERIYEYRNKVEFSWYWDTEADQLELAFFRRGTNGKIPVDGTSLAHPRINELARQIRDVLRAQHIEARALKTLLIRCDQKGNCVWQLYVKDEDFSIFDEITAKHLAAQGGEIIYSDPKSPASRITKRLAAYGDIVLSDTILGVPFRYATEGFFQVNIPAYEQALRDMKAWVSQSNVPAVEGTSAERSLQGEEQDLELTSKSPRRGLPILDMYSGVGTIGLTIGGDDCTLVELDENAVREMKRNIAEQDSTATAVWAPSEKALDYITSDEFIIVDPPRAGLHADVVEKLLEQKPPRIIYLSCNPVTQARDVALLCEDDSYGIAYHRGYNFFPRTPHIEHLVVLDRKN